MPSITIEGRKVNVGEEFFSLTPEEQDATVDEIARELGLAKAAPQAPEVSTAADMLRSAGAGVRRGIEGGIGFLGDAAKMQGDVAGWAAEKLGASPGVQAGVRDAIRYFNPTPLAPTTETLQAASNATIGESYQPQTTAGKYARTVGEFAPAAMAGPGSLARKAATAIVPGMASEAAGQATEGTAAEPFARALGGLAGGIATAGRPTIRPNMGKAPPVADLKQQARDLYRQADDAGVVFSRPAVKRLHSDIMKDFADHGFLPANEPGAAAVYNEIRKLKGNVTLKGLDTIRKMAGNAFIPGNNSNNKLLSQIKSRMDALIDNPQAGEVMMGDAAKGAAAMKGAREVSRRQIKTEILTDIVEKAKNQATGFENGLVIHLRALANNKAKMASFTKAEQDLIRGIVRRPTLHGMMRALSMLSPNSTFGGITTGMGLVSGVLPGLASAGIGAAARKGAEKLTTSKFDQLFNAVGSGVAPPTGPAPVNIDALIRTMLAARSGEVSAKNNMDLSNRR